jgi:Predicted membrane protein
MKAKTNQMASISLIIMLIGFIVTMISGNSTAIVLLQSGFEAGLVGGLADWFAVTALFRYPLGIHIPHTAILPQNRDRITNSLVSIVENDLLNKSSILDKVGKLQIVSKALNLFRENIYSDSVKSGVITITENIANSIPSDKVAIYLNRMISVKINEIDTKNLIELLSNACLENNYEQKILDVLVGRIKVEIKKDIIRNEIGSSAIEAIGRIEINPLMKYTISAAIGALGEEKVGKIIQDYIVLILNDLETQDNRSRIMILESIRKSIVNGKDNEELIVAVDNIKTNITDSSKFNEFMQEQIEATINSVLNYISDKEYIEEELLPQIDNMVANLLENKELINKIEIYIQEQIVNFADKNHSKIGKLVKENIEKLETETLIELIEDKVGNDLQWIRVNGAICGFIIGIALGLIKLVI